MSEASRSSLPFSHTSTLRSVSSSVGSASVDLLNVPSDLPAGTMVVGLNKHNDDKYGTYRNKDKRNSTCGGNVLSSGPVVENGNGYNKAIGWNGLSSGPVVENVFDLACWDVAVGRG